VTGTTVMVTLPRGLEQFTGGVRDLEVEAGTVGEVLAAVERRLPATRGHLADRQGALRPHLLCIVDGAAVRDPATPVGDRVTFLLAVSGG
jgi:molybdopterin converting factor small subunit